MYARQPPDTTYIDLSYQQRFLLNILSLLEPLPRVVDM